MIPFEHLSLDTFSLNALSGAPSATLALDLLNGPAYQNPRYAPAVAPRRPSSLASQIEYLEVEDALTVDIVGANPAAVLRNLQTLLSLIDQAAEWAEGRNVPAVQIRMRVFGGTMVAALILGPTPGQGAGAFVAAPEVAADGTWVMRDVELRFVRRGRLLTTAATSGATSSAASLGVVMTATFPSASETPAPTRVTFQGSNNSQDLIASAVVAVAEGAATVAAVGAGDVLAGGSFSAVADAANFPYGANILRYGSGATVGTEALSVTGAIPVGGSNRLFGAIVVVRPNGATSTWRLRLRVSSVLITNELDAAYTGDVIISGADGTTPRVVVLAPAALRPVGPDALITVRVQAAVTKLGGAGADTLDLDEIVLVALDAPAATIATLTSTDTGSRAVLYPGEYPEALVAGGYAGDGRSPGAFIFAAATSDLGAYTYRGDVAVSTAGVTALGVMLAPNGAAWRRRNVGNTAIVQQTLNLVRRPAYLAPQ